MRYLLLLLLLASCTKKDGYCKFDTIVLQYEERDWSMGEYYPTVRQDSFQLHQPKAHLP